jgi:hypothetical protein
MENSEALAKSAMIATTINSSTSVKPARSTRSRRFART